MSRLRKAVATVALATAAFGAGAAVQASPVIQPTGKISANVPSVIKVPGGHFDTRTSILWCTTPGWDAITDRRSSTVSFAACM